MYKFNLVGKEDLLTKHKLKEPTNDMKNMINEPKEVW